ncbi:MAG: EAL domain-containing protein [Candidatus Dormibacteraeota bacterium]|uniref:EAL domain-containing protein n=1 Tax=Candidatus Amunia macphersoniae TaxID=3127014 RepID=A0A934NFW7_9BACT|nr:EAL domain-containing protein [Candidatus Dormibacteraeota bacterium]
MTIASPPALTPAAYPRLASSPRVGSALRLRLLAAILLVPTIPLWILTLLPLRPFTLLHSLPVWGLVVLFFITERWPVTISVRRSTPSVGLSAAPLVLGLFFSDSWAIIVGFLIGAVLAAASRREMRQPETTFGIAQFSFFAALAVVTFRTLMGVQHAHGGELDWSAYSSVYAAAGVLILTSLTTSFAVALHDGHVTKQLALENVALAVAGIGAAASYGMVAVDLIWANPKGLFVVAVLGVVLLGGYRILLAERRERRMAEFLRGADQALHHSPELESAIVALIGRAREMFDGQIAQLTIYPSSAGQKAYRTTVRAGDPAPIEVMAPIDLTELDDILEADSDGVIIDQGSASPRSRDVLNRRGVDHAMVALLRGRTRLVGSLMVGSHVSARSFDQRDLQLFQTLAIQTTSTLENGRLEHSITRLTELQQQLSHQAFHDSLTDLANRALFSDRIEHALLRRSRTNKPVAVLFIDLDDFKGINDTLGHAAGDELLVGVAERLRSSLRRPDTAARLGGDEFAVLIEDIDQVSEAEAVAERVFLALAAPFALAGQSVTVRASIGIAVSNDDNDTAGGLMSHADVAMYAAKSAGKHQQILFAPGMEAEIVARHRLRADLERAVDADEFGVHFQPIFDLSTGRLVGTEALVRWRHPTRGMVAPDDFIRIAEETGVILELGTQVLRMACAETVRWQVRHPLGQPLWVSVNISARQLAQPQFVSDVLAIVARSCLPPSSLVLELTESMVLENAEASIVKLDALKRVGIRIAIDDFGTGYSSLSYLRRLPVDILKIAKPFVDDLDDSDQGDFARAIVGIGNALRLTMIAEGIENSDQLVTLRELGCHLGQGYHLSHPVIADAIDRMLATGGVDQELLALAPIGAHVLQFSRAAM